MATVTRRNLQNEPLEIVRDDPRFWHTADADIRVESKLYNALQNYLTAAKLDRQRLNANNQPDAPLSSTLCQSHDDILYKIMSDGDPISFSHFAPMIPVICVELLTLLPTDFQPTITAINSLYIAHLALNVDYRDFYNGITKYTFEDDLSPHYEIYEQFVTDADFLPPILTTLFDSVYALSNKTNRLTIFNFLKTHAFMVDGLNLNDIKPLIGYLVAVQNERNFRNQRRTQVAINNAIRTIKLIQILLQQFMLTILMQENDLTEHIETTESDLGEEELSAPGLVIPDFQEDEQGIIDFTNDLENLVDTLNDIIEKADNSSTLSNQARRFGNTWSSMKINKLTDGLRALESSLNRLSDQLETKYLQKLYDALESLHSKLQAKLTIAITISQGLASKISDKLQAVADKVGALISAALCSVRAAICLAVKALSVVSAAVKTIGNFIKSFESILNIDVKIKGIAGGIINAFDKSIKKILSPIAKTTLLSKMGTAQAACNAQGDPLFSMAYRAAVDNALAEWCGEPTNAFISNATNKFTDALNVYMSTIKSAIDSALDTETCAKAQPKEFASLFPKIEISLNLPKIEVPTLKVGC